jgi:hypothetical protein
VSLFLASIYPTARRRRRSRSAAAYFVSGYLFAHFMIGNDGILYGQEGAQNATRQPIGPWISPQVGMSLYECRATARHDAAERAPMTSGSISRWTWGWALDVRQGRTRAWGDIGISGPLTETWTDKRGRSSSRSGASRIRSCRTSADVTVSAAGNA